MEAAAFVRTSVTAEVPRQPAGMTAAAASAISRTVTWLIHPLDLLRSVVAALGALRSSRKRQTAGALADLARRTAGSWRIGVSEPFIHAVAPRQGDL